MVTGIVCQLSERWRCVTSWLVTESFHVLLVEDMIDYRSYIHNLSSCEINFKPEKDSGLNGIRTHDLCDTGAVLYQLSYQATW